MSLAAYKKRKGLRDGHVKRPKADSYTVAVCDFETDPFKGRGYPVRPFAAGFYDGSSYFQFWGDDAAKQLADHIASLETPHIIYAHNGGKFDFMFMLDWIAPEVFCIGARIVKAKIGQHELRDSLSIIPVPLKLTANKMAFDYKKMERSRRERWKPQILEYLKQDCVELYKVVETYRGVFGDALTMASAAMRKLDEAMTPVIGRSKVAVRLTDREDDLYRQWYYGGRVQCFERGIQKPSRGNQFVINDINSSYPHVMATCLHPISNAFKIGCDIDDTTDFAIVDATSRGALPYRDPVTKKLTFPDGRGTFFVTGHELRAGIELGLVTVHRVVESRTCAERVNFSEFINTYWEARKIAKSQGDPVFDLFWKLVMNGAYGKFAQNPRKFKDTLICRLNDPLPDGVCDKPQCEGCELWHRTERHELMDVYTRKTMYHNPRGLWRSYLNVATGASITGAARASLMRGIAAASRPVYCDTDSVICEGMDSGLVRLENGQLGAWKLEHVGDRVAVCEKKLYGFWGDRAADAKVEAERIAKYGDPFCIKIASKGVRLSAADVLKIAGGEAVTWSAEAPTFRRDGSQYWIERRIAMRG